jgi:hypothetical protein
MHRNWSGKREAAAARLIVKMVGDEDQDILREVHRKLLQGPGARESDADRRLRGDARELIGEVVVHPSAPAAAG